jgi:hypothetical protein
MKLPGNLILRDSFSYFKRKDGKRGREKKKERGRIIPGSLILLWLLCISCRLPSFRPLFAWEK